MQLGCFKASQDIAGVYVNAESGQRSGAIIETVVDCRKDGAARSKVTANGGDGIEVIITSVGRWRMDGDRLICEWDKSTKTVLRNGVMFDETFTESEREEFIVERNGDLIAVAEDADARVRLIKSR